METVALRPVADVERDELCAAVDRYWVEVMPNAPIIRDRARRAAHFDERFRLGEPNVIHLWAVVGETKIGFARVVIGEDHDGRWAEIGDFFVERPWRRQGRGRELAEAIGRRLRELGVHRIDLHARGDNPAAVAFWRSVGFDLASYRLRRFLDPGG